MRKLLLAALLTVFAVGADYDMDECQPPDVYADWANPSECVEYYQDLEDQAREDDTEDEEE